MRRTRLQGLLPALLYLAAATPAAAVDVTACGQVVPEGQRAVLQADLSACFWGIVLEPGATLDLNGHHLSGLPDFSDLIVCQRSCTILGPGELSETFEGVVAGAAGAGHRPARRGVLRIDGVTVRDAKFALNAGTAVRARNVVIIHSGRAFSSPRIRGTDVTITSSLPGETIGDGMVRLTRLVLSGGSTLGISAVGLRLVDSYVVCDDAGYPGLDIVTRRRPTLLRSTCGHSAHLTRRGVPLSTWHVCVDDPPAPGRP